MMYRIAHFHQVMADLTVSLTRNRGLLYKNNTKHRYLIILSVVEKTKQKNIWRGIHSQIIEQFSGYLWGNREFSLTMHS